MLQLVVTRGRGREIRIVETNLDRFRLGSMSAEYKVECLYYCLWMIASAAIASVGARWAEAEPRC